MATPIALPRVRPLAVHEPDLDEANTLTFEPERVAELVELVRHTLAPHRAAAEVDQVAIGGRLFLRLDSSGSGQLPREVSEAFHGAHLRVMNDPQFAVITGGDRFLKAETFGARAVVHLDPVCPVYGYFSARHEKSGMFVRLLREAGPDVEPERASDWLAMNLLRAFPAQPGGLVFAVPSHVSDDGSISPSTWPGFHEPGFFDTVVAKAAEKGKWTDPVEVYVAGDLDVAGQEVRLTAPDVSTLLVWVGKTTRFAVVARIA